MLKLEIYHVFVDNGKYILHRLLYKFYIFVHNILLLLWLASVPRQDQAATPFILNSSRTRPTELRPTISAMVNCTE